MENNFRCNCPITSALDIIGDKWSLVIIKQMLVQDKKTFKDFLESDESIATNILASRLKMLEKYEIITKEKLPNNKKVNLYILTEKGLELTPLIGELVIWSYNNISEYHTCLVPDERLEQLKNNKTEFLASVVENYKKENWKQLAEAIV